MHYLSFFQGNAFAMISGLRGKSKGLCRALAKPFAFLGIPPNLVSLLALPLALASAFFVLRQEFLFATAFAALAVCMDLIDGSVAELLKKRTAFGNFFETMVDKAVDFILIGCFVFIYPLAAVLALGLSFLSSYAKPRAALVIVSDNRDWPAIGEHGDKLLILLAGLAISAFFPGIFGIATMEAALYAIALISGIGTIQRIAYAKKLIEEAERKGTLLPYLRQGKER